jgi:tetratricopeptide (TPR) repeat protein
LDKTAIILVLVLLLVAVSSLVALAESNRLFGAKSIGDLKRAIDLSNSAQSFLEQNKIDESITAITKAHDLAPDLGEIEGVWGCILSASGKLKEAVEHEKRAVQVKPDDAMLWRNLGLTYHTLGDETSAASALQKFVYVAPTHPESERARKFIERYQAMAELARDDSVNNYFNAATRGQLYWWHKNGNPIRVFISSSGCPDPRLPEIVQNAFGDWSNASDQVWFDFVRDSKSADLKIFWTKNASELIDSTEGGEAKCEYTDDCIDRAQITFLITRMFIDGKLMPEKAHWFALHEIGHALGLLGHSPNHEDIMYWACPGAFTEIHLTDRDRQTLKMLYASASGAKK